MTQKFNYNEKRSVQKNQYTKSFLFFVCKTVLLYLDIKDKLLIFS